MAAGPSQASGNIVQPSDRQVSFEGDDVLGFAFVHVGMNNPLLLVKDDPSKPNVDQSVDNLEPLAGIGRRDVGREALGVGAVKDAAHGGIVGRSPKPRFYDKRDAGHVPGHVEAPEKVSVHPACAASAPAPHLLIIEIIDPGKHHSFPMARPRSPERIRTMTTH